MSKNINAKRAKRFQAASIKTLTDFAESGSLARAAAVYELQERKAPVPMSKNGAR